MTYRVIASYEAKTKGGERRFANTFHYVPDIESAQRLAKQLVETGAHSATYEETK